MPKYDNSERLSTVSDQDWRKALDELTAYLRWRLKGRTKWGAHSERVLEIPALDYYTEEAAAKLIEGCWKWQDRYSLAEQLIEIASNLITKQAERWKREHGGMDLRNQGIMDLRNDGTMDLGNQGEMDSGFRRKVPEFIELREPERLPDMVDPSTGSGTEEELLDETYSVVYGLVADDEELTLFVSAIEHCGNFKDLPEHTGWEMKKVYRLMEKLMRRVRRNYGIRDSRNYGIRDSRNYGIEDSEDGKKRMKLLEKIYMFEAERKAAEESYDAFGVTREEHQERMLAFIHRKLEEVNTNLSNKTNGLNEH